MTGPLMLQILLSVMVQERVLNRTGLRMMVTV